MNREKITTYAHICILALTLSLAAYIGVKFLFPIIMPFLIAWALAFITRRPADFLANKTHMAKKFWRSVLSLSSMLLLVGGAVYILIRVATEAWDLLSGLATDGSFDAVVDWFLNPMERLFGSISMAPGLEVKLTEALSGILSNLLGNVAALVSSIASAIPKLVLFVLVTAISSVYFALDLENVNKYVHKLLPDKIDKGLIRFKNTSLKVTLQYLRSYFLIMMLTFSVMFFGLSVIGIRYALLMALIIAVLDLLPVIGIGTVLIPWGLFMLMTGDTKTGVGLLILYGIGMILRQIAEPRIVGKQLGIHPLLTLVLMYVGYSLLGLFGLLLLPLFSIILKTLIEKYDTSEVEE